MDDDLDRRLRSIRHAVPGTFTIMAGVFAGLWAFTVSVLVIFVFMMETCRDDMRRRWQEEVPPYQHETDMEREHRIRAQMEAPNRASEPASHPSSEASPTPATDSSKP